MPRRPESFLSRGSLFGPGQGTYAQQDLITKTFVEGFDHFQRVWRREGDLDARHPTGDEGIDHVQREIG